MSLYQQWVDLMDGQTQETFQDFWKKYSDTETRIYQHILAAGDSHLTGRVSDLITKFDAEPAIFMGFLDGINTSLKNSLDLESINEDSQIDLDIDFEKLYFNMHKAEADYLYSLTEWDGVLSADRRAEITREYKRSRPSARKKNREGTILVLAVQVKNTKNAAVPTNNFKEVYAAGSAAADCISIC